MSKPPPGLCSPTQRLGRKCPLAHAPHGDVIRTGRTDSDVEGLGVDREAECQLATGLLAGCKPVYRGAARVGERGDVIGVAVSVQRVDLLAAGPAERLVAVVAQRDVHGHEAATLQRPSVARLGRLRVIDGDHRLSDPHALPCPVQARRLGNRRHRRQHPRRLDRKRPARDLRREELGEGQLMRTAIEQHLERDLRSQLPTGRDGDVHRPALVRPHGDPVRDAVGRTQLELQVARDRDALRTDVRDTRGYDQEGHPLARVAQEAGRVEPVALDHDTQADRLRHVAQRQRPDRRKGGGRCRFGRERRDGGGYRGRPAPRADHGRRGDGQRECEQPTAHANLPGCSSSVDAARGRHRERRHRARSPLSSADPNLRYPRSHEHV